MNRQSSPLLHDYKSPERPTARQFKAVHWFAVGLGLPLLGIALLLTFRSAAGDDPLTVVDKTTESVLETENRDAEIRGEIPLPDAAEIELDAQQETTTAFHPPLQLAPEYQKVLLTVKRGDTLDRLFRKNNLSIADLAAIVRLSTAAPHLKKLIPGDELTIEHDNGELISLYKELGVSNALHVSRAEMGYDAEIVERAVKVKRKLAYGKINSSLFESAMKAGLGDALIMNLAGIFAWDVDFVLDIRTGDDYYILYEEVFQDGEHVADGAILAAEFNNNGRTFQAIRYVDKNERADYFTPEGRSVRKAFVRAPVDFSRISSSFNPNRRHPILNTIRAHRGVDYAAPSGTPIKAAGDGKIIFRGAKSGYGNAVIIQHGGNITTLYAHMSRFNSAARISSRVIQGQTIGYVGKTGLATAPHLHYEYRLNGVHRNPRTVKLPQAAPINEEYRTDFLQTVEPVLDELLQYKRTQVAALTLD